jgi:hypothetical protein
LIVRKMGCWFRLRKSHIYHKSSGPDSLFGSNRCRDILTFSSTGSNALLLAAEPNDRAFIEHYYTTTPRFTIVKIPSIVGIGVG